MIGRCLRVIEGKSYGLIIDHVSNVLRHGLPDKFIAWTLARRDKRGAQAKDPDEIELMVCHVCTKPYEKFHTACPYCGAIPLLPEPGSRTIDMVDGDLILLDRAMLGEMRRAMELENPGDIAERVGAVAGEFAGRGAANKQIEKIAAHGRLHAAISQWAGVQRHAGFEDRHIHKKFFLTMGCDVLTTLDGSRSRQEFDTMAPTREGW